ncbi:MULTISPECIES: hypothetical protein [unclassified Roseateles]|uniref:hypothetical protein n=1 Tax=unclassified Roseateles TaxID=2626991 RepID=UPI0006FA449E|nr:MULTISPECIES: hypothetical protein [unclassified Roseateles]KQW45503.1 hypothetical protein ASC81_11375 [Pelomonas sp. Root405]KRA72347.1 hypothetical protein ASD88_11375 [Pelomonas sp. Root662]
MRLVLIATLALLTASAAQATSFASSAAGAGSASSGSVSDSFKASSGSSTGGDKRAEGRYRVTEVAQADAGKLRLTLARDGAAQPNDTVELTLPQQALAARAVNVGDAVQATPQPYGVAFAHADTGQAFFLVLEDAWHRELAARVVKP